VSRPRATTAANSGGDSSDQAASVPPTIKVVGTVGSVVRFNGLADFQYLPLDTTFRCEDVVTLPWS